MAYEGLWEPVQSRYCSKGPEKDRRDNGEVMERVLLYQWWGGARTMQECREWVGIGRGKLQHRPGWVLCRKTRRAIGVLGKTGNCTFEVGKSDFRIRPLRIAKSGDHGGNFKTSIWLGALSWKIGKFNYCSALKSGNIYSPTICTIFVCGLCAFMLISIIYTRSFDTPKVVQIYVTILIWKQWGGRGLCTFIAKPQAAVTFVFWMTIFWAKSTLSKYLSYLLRAPSLVMSTAYV